MFIAKGYYQCALFHYLILVFYTKRIYNSIKEKQLSGLFFTFKIGQFLPDEHMILNDSKQCNKNKNGLKYMNFKRIMRIWTFY